MPRTLTALLSICLILLVGCTAPAPVPAASTPALVPASPTIATPSLTAEPSLPATPLPSPTPVTRLVINQEPVQAWTDPNLVAGLLVHRGEVWAATQSGVVRWDLQTGEMTRYGADDGLVAHATRGIALDADGRVWIGYAELDAWSAWEGDGWVSYVERERAVEAHYAALLESPYTDPRLWVTRPDSSWIWLPEIRGRAQSYDGQRWRLYGENQGVRSGIWLVDVSPGGQVWAVGSAVSTVYEGQVYWDDHSYYSGMGAGCSVTSGAVDDNDGLWLGYACEGGMPGGLMYWDMRQGRWRGYEHALNPLIPQQVHWVQVDDCGTIWVGGAEAVIWKSPESPWRRFDLPGYTVRAIYTPDGTDEIWLGTQQGALSLSRETGNITTLLRVPVPPIPANVSGLAVSPEGSLWLATMQGVLAVDPTTGELSPVHPAPATVIASERGGPIWIAGPNGVMAGRGTDDLALVVPANVRTLALSPDGTHAVACTSGGDLLHLTVDGSQETLVSVPALFGATAKALALADDGEVWVGTGVGLGHIASGGEPRLLTVDDGLPHNDVLALAWGPEGELWIGTRSGLARLRPDGRWTRFTTTSTGGGLRSMTVRAFAHGQDGILWMATGAGISSREPEEADWAYLDLAGAQALAVDRDGNLWIGTNAGLVRVTTAAMTPVED